MKRLVCICLALWLGAASGALAQEAPPAPFGAELSQEEALALAQEQFAYDVDFLEAIPQEFTLSLQKVEEEPGLLPAHYIAAFTTPRIPDMAYYVLVPARAGQFPPCGGGQMEASPQRLERELGENYRIWSATQAWQEKRGPYCFWPYEEKAAFAAQFGSEPGQWKQPSSLTLPQGEDVSLQTAQRRADAFLEREFALTREQIAAMPKDIAFYAEHYTGNLGHTRCWLLLYRGELPAQDGLYPLLYQVTVPSPQGEVHGLHNMEADSLMALGLSAHAAAKLTELTTLYHIPGGGRFYHMVDDCASVPEKYRPMTGFDTGKLDGEGFRDLAPCPFCIQ